MGFLAADGAPVIEGQLKEKKGRWRIFRRWRTRYFTLSGAHLSCKGSVSIHLPLSALLYGPKTVLFLIKYLKNIRFHFDRPS